MVTEYRDIRFSKDKSIKLLRRNIISRPMLSSSYMDDNITLTNVSYPFATKIIKAVDVDVKVKDNWVFVKNNDIAALDKAYAPETVQQYGVKVETAIVEEEPSVEEVAEKLEEIAQEVINEEPVVEAPVQEEIPTLSDPSLYVHTVEAPTTIEEAEEAKKYEVHLEENVEIDENIPEEVITEVAEEEEVPAVSETEESETETTEEETTEDDAEEAFTEKEVVMNAKPNNANYNRQYSGSTRRKRHH